MDRNLEIITACAPNVSLGQVANQPGTVMTGIEVTGEDYVVCEVDVEIDVLTHAMTAAASATDKTATIEAWAMLYEDLAIVIVSIATCRTATVNMDTVDAGPEMMTGATRQAELGCVDDAMTIWGIELMAVAAVMGQLTLVLDSVDFVLVAAVVAGIEVLGTLAVTRTVTATVIGTVTEMAITTSSMETAVTTTAVVVTEAMPAGIVIGLARVGTEVNTEISIRVRYRMMLGRDGEAMAARCRRMETVLTMKWHKGLNKGAIKMVLRDGVTTSLRPHPKQLTNT